MTRTRTSSDSIRRDIAVNIVGNALLGVLGIASGSVISYRNGSSGRGLISVAQVISAFAASIGSLGLGDALLFHIARSHSVTRRRFLLASLGSALGGAALGLGSALIGVRVLKLDVSDRDFIFYITLVSGAMAMTLVPAGALRGQNRFVAWNASRVATTVCWIGALIAGGRGKIDLRTVGTVYAIALTAVALVSMAAVSTQLDVNAPYERAHATTRALLRFGIPSAFATAPLLLNARIDQALLATVASTDLVGQYAAAVGYCWATVPLVQAVTSLASRRVAAERDPSLRAPAVAYLSNLGVSLVLLSTAAAWVAAPIALRILNGPGFGLAVGVARILLIGTGLQGLSLLLEEAARGLGQPKGALYAEVAGLTVMVVMLMFFVRHGVQMTAVASVLGYVTSLVVILYLVSRSTQMPALRLLRPLVPCSGGRRLHP